MGKNFTQGVVNSGGNPREKLKGRPGAVARTPVKKETRTWLMSNRITKRDLPNVRTRENTSDKKKNTLLGEPPRVWGNKIKGGVGVKSKNRAAKNGVINEKIMQECED